MSTDAEFIRALEQGSLPADEFDHAAHLRAGYLYLRDLGFARDNPDLFARDLLLDYYDADRLACDLARRTFLLPKRVAA